MLKDINSIIRYFIANLLGIPISSLAELVGIAGQRLMSLISRACGTSIGYIAQWLERLTADQQVPGSNPGVPSLPPRVRIHGDKILLKYQNPAGKSDHRELNPGRSGETRVFEPA